MENIYGKEIRISDLEEGHWTFLSDILWNVKKHLGDFPDKEALIYAKVQHQEDCIQFLAFNQIDEDDPKYSFIEPGYLKNAAEIISSY